MKNERCATCFFWSEEMAFAGTDVLMTAMCLCKDSDNYKTMTTIRTTCSSWKNGHGVSIDSHT